MTETARIAANNAYQRQLAQAESDYNADMTELNNYVRTEQERLDDKAKAEQDANYNEIMSSVRNGDYNTVADLDRYLGITTDENGNKVFGEGSIAAGLSDFQQANILNLYQTIASDPEQKAAEKEIANAYNEDGSKKIEVKTTPKANLGGYLDYIYVGNDFKIGGYKVELGEKVSDDVVPSAAVEDIGDKQAFVYDGVLYIKVGDNIHIVRGRGGKYSTDDYKNALALFD